MLDLEQLVMHPDHRKRGARWPIVEWDNRKADELGIGSCVESVPSVVPFYEAVGYTSTDCLGTNVSIGNQGPE
ncbi:hypothetical protein F5Y10DRAFT_71301 [Nemania abortiva]|nr:hypothetical protein F5Y10DRAFT_71301 [Nemania abortiva]